ncbi:Cupin domain protein [Legionella santicrucis]|uniref:Cupin domain protein n=1 Tax=Legionella santicrucis TaxID=45074 RepID=A0A0W0YA53_9GAMM|nr:cupin domain-containing protein [Legionella santicrucis]KTD53470.1 Cupin domain protein [Legionella santicrucis]
MKISTKNAPHFRWGQDCDGWWLKNEGHFTVVYEIMPAGSAELKHYHLETEQFFYCLQGQLTIELDSFSETLQAHQGLTIKANIPHQAKNKSGKPCVFLVISSPNLSEGRINLAEK